MNARHDAAGDNVGPPADDRTYRILKAVVIILGILLVLSFFIVFGTIIYRVSNLEPRAPEAVETTLPIPADAVIVDVSAGDGRILVTVRDGSGTAIYVLDGRSYTLRAVIRPQ